MLALVLLLACHPATPVDWCVENPGECAACDDDAQCTWAGNACTEYVYCIEQDADLSVIMIGCTVGSEYDWPAASACGCVSGECRSR